MSDGQARVLLLLVALLVLELVAHPAVKRWFKTAYKSVGTGVQPKK